MLTFPSFAKINWTLEILGKRPDGYHELRTLLQTVSVADELDFEVRERGIELRCEHPQMPLDETNLIYRAAKLLREVTGCDKGVRVTIRKQLPMAAGLGGGSSASYRHGHPAWRGSSLSRGSEAAGDPLGQFPQGHCAATRILFQS